MADIHIDIERMIMHSNYLLEVDNSSASNGLSDMERKQYLDQIKDLVQTVQTLLDANIALGNKQKELQAEADRKIAGLQDQVDKLTGELQARRRKMHGKNNEKQTGDKSVNTGKTKDEEEGGDTSRMDVSNLPILMIQTKLPTQRRPIPKRI